MQTVTLTLYRFDTWRARAWALGMMGLGRILLPRVPDIGFWKLCGAGKGEGFTPTANMATVAILATWPDHATAQFGTQHSASFQRYARKADESWTVYLSATRSSGAWAGQAPFEVSTQTSDGPLAALTRATIKPGIAAQFWRRVPDISRMIGSDPNVAFKIGIGEVPLLHQVTFSIWPDAQAMAAFARQDGPHARAIRAVRAGKWFREELYARFAILGDHGTWGGSSPLDRLEAA
ncbi:spheroidene monooxygenase [Pseudaestuariivita atlantica]|uniref:spheroidene monooxygenase n=1 Tax=Pseudaestuariivita atlantica TaxID=1317121 RepID=UPI003BF815BB